MITGFNDNAIMMLVVELVVVFVVVFVVDFAMNERAEFRTLTHKFDLTCPTTSPPHTVLVFRPQPRSGSRPL